MSKCFVTGADSNHEDMLPWWIRNVQKHMPNIDIVVADFGMSPTMLKTITKEGVSWICNCKQSKKYPLCDGTHTTHKGGRYKPTRISTENVKVTAPIINPFCAWFFKPRAMLECLYEYVCWLDIDCEVVAPCEEIFDFPTTNKMALTKDVIRDNLWATGVNVVKGKPDILYKWADVCETNSSGIRGDQECLAMLIGKSDEEIIEMPQEYQWLRLTLSQGIDSPNKKIIHWTGPVGKQHIREDLMR